MKIQKAVLISALLSGSSVALAAGGEGGQVETAEADKLGSALRVDRIQVKAIFCSTLYTRLAGNPGACPASWLLGWAFESAASADSPPARCRSTSRRLIAS